MIATTKKILWITGAVLWVLMLGIGIRALLAYENTPGEVAAAPVEWPVASQVELASDMPTLLMLAHPLCPCTRASMEEFDRLMTQAQGKAKAYVIFIKPVGMSEKWEQTSLWMRASSIPGITVIGDAAGTEARRFQTMTSGQTLLYDKDGKLLFEGGITSERGHEGDNEGRASIVSLINSGSAVINKTSVFGCPLFKRSEDCPGEEVTDESKKN